MKEPILLIILLITKIHLLTDDKMTLILLNTDGKTEWECWISAIPLIPSPLFPSSQTLLSFYLIRCFLMLIPSVHWVQGSLVNTRKFCNILSSFIIIYFKSFVLSQSHDTSICTLMQCIQHAVHGDFLVINRW